MISGLKGTRCLLVLFILLFILGDFSFADERTLNLVSTVLESFDDPNVRSWALIPSKFGYDREGKSTFEQKIVAAWPEGLFGKNRDKQDYKVLGIKGSYMRKGYNYLEIVPGTGSGNDFKPQPIPIPGRVAMLDLWAWGANYNYYLEAQIRDFNGVAYTLPLGSLQYAGWKNLRVEIPGSIPQSQAYLPRLKSLELVKLVLWTRPQERVDEFYLYLDQIKVLTDLFESKYDGDDLAEEVKLQETWGTGKK